MTEQSTTRERALGHLRAMVPLLAVYLALTGNVGVSNVVVGVLVALGASVLAGPPPWRAGRGQVVKSVGKAGVYVGLLAVDVVKCGLRVTGVILSRRPAVKPGIIAIEPGSQNAAVLAASSHGITITPGEMVLEVGNDGTLYTHCLDSAASGESAPGQQLERARVLKEIMGVQDKKAEVRR